MRFSHSVMLYPYTVNTVYSINLSYVYNRKIITIYEGEHTDEPDGEIYVRLPNHIYVEYQYRTLNLPSSVSCRTCRSEPDGIEIEDLSWACNFRRFRMYYYCRRIGSNEGAQLGKHELRTTKGRCLVRAITSIYVCILIY